MKDQQLQFLQLLGQCPARLTVEQVAFYLNMQTHDIPILVAARLLKPLGNPPPNGIKYFCTAEVLGLATDRAWLAKVSNAIVQHWQRKNARKQDRSGIGGPNGDAPAVNFTVTGTG